jgi:hypothetical protein
LSKESIEGEEASMYIRWLGSHDTASQEA